MDLPEMAPVAVNPTVLDEVTVVPVRLTPAVAELIALPELMALLLLDTPVMVMSLFAYRAPPMLTPMPATAVVWVATPEWLLSIVMVPGSGMAVVATTPVVIAEPLDLSNRLISLLDVAALTVTVPIVTAEALVPVVASKMMLEAVPLVLAVLAIVPVCVILLFEVSVRLEPLARLTAPTSTPKLAPAAVLLPVTLMLAPAPVTVRMSIVATVVAVVLVALTVMPVLAEIVAPVTMLIALPVVDVEVRLTEPLDAVKVPAATEPEYVMAVLPSAEMTMFPLAESTAADVITALFAFETPVKVMPLLAYKAPSKVRPSPDTAPVAATVPPLVLSILMLPGSTLLLAPTVPGLIAAPLDLIFRLMSLVLPAVTLKLPVVMDEALEPDVASNVRVAALPLVLAAALMAPTWLIRLFELSVMLEPLASAIVPVCVIPVLPPAAVLLAVTVSAEPAF